AITGFAQKLQHPGRKAEPGNGSVKTLADGVTKSLLCVLLILRSALFIPDMRINRAGCLWWQGVDHQRH
ncbi:hypothetical protein ACEV99_22740, partial [Vibrio parahaemolyticus]